VCGVETRCRASRGGLDGIAAWPFPVLQMLGVWLTLRGAAVIDIFDLAGVRQLHACARG
jgi:hypothetical protein